MKIFCRMVLICITLVYLATPFVPADLTFILFILGLSILLMAFPVMGKTTKYTVSCFFAASLCILIFLRKPFGVFIAGTGYMPFILPVSWSS